MKFPVLILLLTATAAGAALPQTGGSAEHDYILGRYAYANDKIGDAARYFDQARRRDPSDATLGRRAFELAVAAGDEKLSFALAAQLTAAKQGDTTVALARMVDAIIRRDWAAVDVARAGLSGAGYAGVVGPVVEAWTAYGRGDVTGALTKLNPDKAAGFTKSYLIEQRAHLFAAAGRYAEAAAIYHELRTGLGTGASFMRVGEADALQQAGKASEAAAVLDEAPDALTRAASARLKAGRRIGALAADPRAAIGWAFARLATDMAREKPVPLALTVARLSTFLAPGNGATWMITGDILARSGQSDAALAVYGRIPASDALFESARARRADVLGGSGRDDAALALLQADLKTAPDDPSNWARLGDFYRRTNAHAEAARAYGKAIELAPEATANWSAYFLRGSSFEQAGDWAAAEPDLRRAQSLAPDEPMVLNYLGYALLDRGLTLDAAQAMIEQASKLQPDDGFITDSLGWALFRRGRFAESVPILERAVAAQPGDPTINEHLGDAYWRNNRRIEARFRWRAALDLDPEAKAKAAIAAKLDFGLDAVKTTAAR